VLQALVLTDKEKMIVTPTYHVFELYTPHHDATLLPTELACADYRFGDERIPAVSVSASRDKSGTMHVSLCNLNPNEPMPISAEVQGAKVRSATGRVLTAPDMRAHNTFDQPDQVRPEKFDNVRVTDAGFEVTLPPKSVTVISLE
jgi:alpha-N-arabinofuranosidase